MARLISLHVMRQCLIECGKPVPTSLDYAVNKRAFDAATGGFMTGGFRTSAWRPTGSYTSTYTATYIATHVPKSKNKEKSRKHKDKTHRSGEQVQWKKMSELSDRELQLLFQDEPTEADLDDIERDLNETYENEVADIERESTDEIAPIVTVNAPFMGIGPREINGHLDHTYCEHTATKTARRRCCKAWLDGKNS